MRRLSRSIILAIILSLAPLLLPIATSLQREQLLAAPALADPTCGTSSTAIQIDMSHWSQTEGETFTFDLAHSVATIFDGHGQDPPSAYTVTVYWGDGSHDASGGGNVTLVQDSGNNVEIQASHAYPEEDAGSTREVQDYTRTVVVSDSDGDSGCNATDQFTVKDAPVTITGTTVDAPATMVEGADSELQVATFTDADQGGKQSDYSVQIEFGTPPCDAMLGGGTGGVFTVSISKDPTSCFGDEEGLKQGNVTITEASGAQYTADWWVLVSDAPITLTVDTPISFREGRNNTSPQLIATVADSNSLEQAATTPFEGFQATIDWGDNTTTPDTESLTVATDGTISANHAYPEEGTYTASLTVTDPGGATKTEEFQVTVLDNFLTPHAIDNITAPTNAPVTALVCQFLDLNPDSTNVDFTGTTINWGDGTTSSPDSIVKQPDSTNFSGDFEVTGTHTYHDQEQHTVRTKVIDKGGESASCSIYVNKDQAFTAQDTGTLTVNEGDSLQNAVLATIIDPDPKGTASDYTATVDWGEADSVFQPASVIEKNGKIEVLGSHTFHEDGPLSVTLDISDADAPQNEDRPEISLTVKDTPVQIGSSALPTVHEGEKFHDTLATFTTGSAKVIESDPNMTATIDWGDKTPIENVDPSTLTDGKLPGDHVYKEEGSYLVNYTITDPGTTPTKGHTTIKVEDAKLQLAGDAITATEGKKFSGNVGYILDDDPNGAAADYTATINWGDGAQSPGGFTVDPGGGFFVTGSHTYKDEKIYHTTIDVKDSGGSTATATGGTAAVADALLATINATAFTVNEGASFSKGLTTFTDANATGTAADFAAAIDWGDKSKHTAGGITGVGPFAVSGTHTYAKAGNYQAKVAVVDKGGKSTGAVVLIHVKDVPISATGVAVKARRNVQFSGTVATLTDADPGAQPANYTITIDWGDTSSSSGTVVRNKQKQLEVHGTHTYVATGPFTIKITVMDFGGSQSKTTAPATVSK